MRHCLLPPLDDRPNRGYWLTAFWHIPEIEPLRIAAVFGCGRSDDEAFLLIQSADGKRDLSAYSLSSNPGQRIWGGPNAVEHIVVEYIKRNGPALLAHWRGENDSSTLARLVGER